MSCLENETEDLNRHLKKVAEYKQHSVLSSRSFAK